MAAAEEPPAPLTNVSGQFNPMPDFLCPPSPSPSTSFRFMSKCFSEPFCSPSPHQAGDAIHGTYFPHIDGLRTFAVLAVVLYHLQEWICPGGYTGVDIFFVISGYLIGSGLVRSLKEGNFSLSSFYYRRIRRIMPAYFCLIAVVLAFGCVVLACDDLRTLGRTVRSSALFITNIYFSRTAGNYFSPAAEENPLLNLWSLSVEEQFYLMIPLTLWLL
ncbi:MAG: acyltransferase family protein [Akkermansia sp.]